MIKINESRGKLYRLTDKEKSGLRVLIGSDAEAGIVEASNLYKKLNQIGGVIIDSDEIGYLEYWESLLKNYPNSPKCKYMNEDGKSAIRKIFKF